MSVMSISSRRGAALPFTQAYWWLVAKYQQATDEVTDPELLKDIKSFSQQEGNHHQNHARIDRVMRSHFDEPTQQALLEIAANLKRDYEDFLKNSSLAFNLAYAEGFEAMTCAFALAGAGRSPDRGLAQDWSELLDWHGLEEIPFFFPVFHGRSNVPSSLER